jgi:hypothetical protein
MTTGPALRSRRATAARSSRSCLRERVGGGDRTGAGGRAEAGVGGGVFDDDDDDDDDDDAGGCCCCCFDDDVDADSTSSPLADRRLKIPAHVRQGIDRLVLD